MTNPNDLVGKKYVFEDESEITIIQVKKKDINEETVDMITYTISQGSNLPRKLVMPYNDFMGHFGHLFET